MREDFVHSAPVVFWYRPSPVSSRSFQILQLQEREGYVPVGDYTVLDRAEATDLSEKKLRNLISLMNGQERLLDLRGDCSGMRTLFQVCPSEEGDPRKRIVFRNYDGNAVSKENALLQIDARLWGDEGE